MITKEKLIERIQSMPDDRFTNLDSFLEEIILIDKIENALKEVKNGEMHNSDDVNKMIAEW